MIISGGVWTDWFKEDPHSVGTALKNNPGVMENNQLTRKAHDLLAPIVRRVTFPVAQRKVWNTYGFKMSYAEFKTVWGKALAHFRDKSNDLWDAVKRHHAEVKRYHFEHEEEEALFGMDKLSP